MHTTGSGRQGKRVKEPRVLSMRQALSRTRKITGKEKKPIREDECVNMDMSGVKTFGFSLFLACECDDPFRHSKATVTFCTIVSTRTTLAFLAHRVPFGRAGQDSAGRYQRHGWRILGSVSLLRCCLSLPRGNTPRSRRRHRFQGTTDTH